MCIRWIRIRNTVIYLVVTYRSDLPLAYGTIFRQVLFLCLYRIVFAVLECVGNFFAYVRVPPFMIFEGCLNSNCPNKRAR